MTALYYSHSSGLDVGDSPDIVFTWAFFYFANIFIV